MQLAVRNDRVALFAGITLVSGLPGVLVFRILSRRIGRRGCLLCAIGWWCALVATFAGLLRSPSDQGWAIALALPTGVRGSSGAQQMARSDACRMCSPLCFSLPVNSRSVSHAASCRPVYFLHRV